MNLYSLTHKWLFIESLRTHINITFVCYFALSRLGWLSDFFRCWKFVSFFYDLLFVGAADAATIGQNLWFFVMTQQKIELFTFFSAHFTLANFFSNQRVDKIAWWKWRFSFRFVTRQNIYFIILGCCFFFQLRHSNYHSSSFFFPLCHIFFCLSLLVYQICLLFACGYEINLSFCPVVI